MNTYFGKPNGLDGHGFDIESFSSILSIDEREGSLLKQFTFEETAVVFKCLNQFKLV